MSKKKKSEACFKLNADGTLIISEFMQALSDNQKTLEELEKSPSVNIPVLCRFWILHIVTTFEYLLRSHLKSEQDTDELKDIANIKIPHKERILNLEQILSLYGPIPAKKILHDFEAIIYLRNYIIHGHWSKTQKQYVSNSSFTTNINEFTEENVHQCKHVYRIITDLLMNRLLVRTSNDIDDFRKICQSLGIEEELFDNIQSMIDIYRYIFIAFGISENQFNKCLIENSNNIVEIDMKKFDEIFEMVDFDEKKIENFMQTLQKVFKKNLVNE